MQLGYILYTFTAAAAALSLMALAACQSASAPLPEEPADLLARGADSLFCGGIAGFECPPGYVCADDPTDDCHPDSGGADCGGICQAPPSDCLLHGDRGYISLDPAECAAILFLCAEGYTPFFDECGCGCEPDPPAPTRGEPCGRSSCGRGEYCCNESCGVCAPIGGSCIQVECE